MTLQARSESGPEILGLDTVAGYLSSRCLLPAGVPISASALGGGVSNVVFAVEGGNASLVVKQALPRLRVRDEWLASQERALAEAAALHLAGLMSPGFVPKVLDLDPERFVVVVERAPAGWSDWKCRLLAGDVEVSVARRLGELLSTWQSCTRDPGELDPLLHKTAPFDQLRLEPYYRTVARRLPHLAPLVAPYLDAAGSNHRCLVHGDFSPKNVLVSPDQDRLWVIDFEVAHLGEPAFDPAFLLSHLLLKSIHRPQSALAYRDGALAFASAYHDGVPPELEPQWTSVAGHTGVLLVARVHGKSPVEYLDAPGQAWAHRLGTALLEDPPGEVGALWSVLDRVGAR